MKHKGFTLIELLIVVAIIAILAAIAVPNFLEAQTRSKVSRTKSDLRTIGMSIRMYEVDNNRPIPCANDPFEPVQGDFRYWWIWLDMGSMKGGSGRYLTTPVSYVTSLPNDIFNPSLNGSSDNGMTYVRAISYNYFYVGKANEGKITMDQAHGFHPANDPDAWKIYGQRPYRWSIFSPGPDLVWYLTNKSAIYDPTNGTVSAGDIGFWDAVGLIGGGGN